MKKVKTFCLWLFLLAVSGCSIDAERTKHDSLYAGIRHGAFSIYGHRSATADDARISAAEGWWGEEVVLREQPRNESLREQMRAASQEAAGEADRKCGQPRFRQR